ncbi:MAG: hypothetical protein GTN62_04680 [Gemmatimonadales bacterium]|nr:hypothetical protein [Gemmatimonadales bacterium]NIN10633.1 hypothetical protein [Gemmatimonadales bacterium]NIN49395.1 hypothetical protein [Gemmatimonadales bacterium]NIP06859.1 hypothetical protein [Gemmatimonadales bacterium]NIR01533.1 hypothetical protein [Gemmatimonadales bacterium]
MTRLDPFDYAFAQLAETRFAKIREETSEAPRHTTDRARFAALPSVQHILADVEAPDVIEANPTAADEYLSALYVAYRFWDAGCPVFTVARKGLEEALASERTGSAPSVPGGACYLRFPERWCWAQIGPAEPHEPLDGLFLAASPDNREITIVAVLGLRSDRPGFSQVTVTAAPEDFAAARQEARTPLFAPVLDGGEAAGLKSVVTTAEVLQLAEMGLAAVGY